MCIYPYSKAPRLIKSSPLLLNVLKNILDPKKKSPPKGALLKVKKGANPLIVMNLSLSLLFNFVVFSLHWKSRYSLR